MASAVSQAERTRLLGTQAVPRLLVRLSGPAIAGMMGNALYNLVDTIFVGRGVGTEALAALAVSFPMQMVLLAVAQTVGIGAGSIVSRRLGAGMEEEAGRTASGSFLLVGVLGLVISALGLVFLDDVLRLFGAGPTVLPYARRYLSVVLLGGPLFTMAVSSNGLARAEGNTKVAMAGMFIGAGVNIVLDPVFIFLLDMGIRGAALATIIGQACGFTWIVRYFLCRRSNLRLARRHIRPTWRMALNITRTGSPSFARLLSGTIMAIAVNNSVMHYGTATELAVLGVINRTLIFAWMPLFGLVQGLQPVVGYNYGAGHYGRVREALWWAMGLATGLTAFYTGVFQLFPSFVLGVFSTDPELVEGGRSILRTIVILMPLIGVQIVGAGAFQALGKAATALVLSIARRVLFLVPLVLLLPTVITPSLRGIWLAFPGADILAFTVTAIFMVRLLVRLGRDGGGTGGDRGSYTDGD